MFSLIDICTAWLDILRLKIFLMFTSMYDTVTSFHTTERGAKNGDVEEKRN